MRENIQKLLYTVVTSQTISSSGRHLYACSTFGDIASYNIEKITSCIENVKTDEDISDPISIFKSHESPISLNFHRDFLIVGNKNGLIIGYKTSSGIIENKSWIIKLPLSPEKLDISEVSDLYVDSENETLYAACGSDVYQCSLDNGAILNKFEGHEDFIHTVKGYEQNFVTSSADGTVKLWDNRTKKASFSIKPSENMEISRSQFGSWMGSASISKVWLACGGGPKLAVFHLNQITKQPFQIFDYSTQIHVTDFVDLDNLLVAGGSNKMVQYSLNGNMISDIRTSGPDVYSVVWHKNQQYKFLSACGASNNIDISINFTYKDATLNFYKRT